MCQASLESWYSHSKITKLDH